MKQSTSRPRAVKAKRRPRGVILYRGPSQLDGRPIVVVATGLAEASDNRKTGAMVQTWILTDGIDPLKAKRTGRDRSICGNCPHAGQGGACYVRVGQAPLSVYRAVRRRIYPRFNPTRHLDLFRGRSVRLGSYGDPAAVPLPVWETLLPVAASHTGYTHQWRDCNPAYRHFLMASVETVAGREEAQANGWRTFRVLLPGQPLGDGEFSCPASAEAGNRRTCADCKACSGGKRGGRNASPAIVFHGSSIGGNYMLRRWEQAIARLEAAETGRIALPVR